MAVVNSFAKFFEAVYPAEGNVLNTAPTYGDAINVLDGTYDPGGGGVVPAASDVRFGVSVGAGTGLAYIPAAADVQSGVNVDQTVGTLTVPTESQTLSGVSYGGGGTEFTGNVVLPMESEVLESIPFGPSGLNEGTVVIPAESQVLVGSYGPDNALTGNVVLPAASDVRTAVAYGSSSSIAGTCAVPVAAEVLLGVSVDATIGTVRLPSVDDVNYGVVYGPSDTLEGSLVVGGGGGGDATSANQAIIIAHLADIKGATFDGSTDSLEAIRDRGDAAWITGSGGTVGPGAIEHTITVLSEGDPVDGAQVWVTLDLAGTQVIAGALTTDAFGQVVFMLDAGTYYQWAQKTGVNFDNPSSFVVA